MKKAFPLLIFLFLFSGLSAQELKLKLNPKQGPVKIFGKAKVVIELYNTTNKPLIIFRHAYKEYGAVEKVGYAEVNGKKTKLLEWGMDTNSRFSAKQFLTLAPGKSMVIAGKNVELKEAGEYTVSYSFKQDPDKLVLGWAKNAEAKRVAKNMSKFEVSGSFKFSVDPTEQKELVLDDITYEALKDKKIVSILAEAIANPSEAYKVNVRADQEGRLDLESIAKLGELKNLRSLSLRIGKEDVTLPADLNEIPLMELTLDSRGGKIIFPKNFGSNFNLRKLTLNRIGSIPMDMPIQPELTFLSIREIDAPALPAWIGQLKKIENISLWNVGFKEFPDSFKQLTSLTRLSVYGSEIESFESILNNVNLTNLSLTRNKIKAISPEVKNLKKCKSFQIEQNMLTAIPVEVYQMSSLEMLQIGRNNLTSLPEGIDQLSKLKNLNVRENKLTSMPKGILNCKNLNFFNGKENSFRKDKTVKALKKMLDKKGKKCLLK